MLYKKKKTLLFIVLLSIFYVFLFIFIVMGLFQLTSFSYEQYYKPTTIIEHKQVALTLTPVENPTIISNNILMDEKTKDEEPIIQDPKFIQSINVISNYYLNIIRKNIKPHFSANENNMCKLAFNVEKNEISIVSCDDYTFRRQVEIALMDSKPFKDKIVNGIDLSKEVVYFDYSTKVKNNN